MNHQSVPHAPVKSILLVEDNPNDEALILRSLNKANVANQVIITRDGEEALNYLFAKGPFENRNPSDLPAVILLDIKLPKVDGLEVLKHLREQVATRFLPVVMLTSSDEERDLVESYKFGANSYVRKPVKFDEFIEAVRHVGLYWLLLNQTPHSKYS